MAPSDSPNPLRILLSVTAAIEVGAGITLAIAPSAVVQVLLGSPLDSPAGVVIGRVLAAALFSLGVACWLTRNNDQDRTAGGLVWALLLYNIASVSLLGYARLGMGMTGVGLLPAVVLHSLLSLWCIACLGFGRRAIK